MEKTEGEMLPAPEVKFAGTLPEKVHKGKRVQIRVSPNKHPRYGDQYDIVEVLEPSQTIEQNKTSGVEVYLMGTVPGVGEKTANVIYEHFGEEAWDVIAKNPERLNEVKDLAETKAEAFAQYLRAHNNEHLQSLFCRLHECEISLNMCKSIMTEFGKGKNPLDDATIREDPYVLLRVHGLSFEKVDDIARKVMSCEFDSPVRFKACVHDRLITKNYDGDTAFQVGDFIQEMAHVPYGYIHSQVRELLTQMVGEKSLVQVEYGNESYIQHPQMYDLESGIAQCIRKIQKSTSSLPRVDTAAKVAGAEEISDFDSFSDKQKEGLVQALGEDKVSVLTGGPGTGKTAVLGALVHILREMDARIGAVAPTGVAAKRLEDSTGVETSTIHRLIKNDPSTGESEYDRNNLLEVDFVIVDEASMLDTSIANALLSALPPPCHLLFVGDNDQLPSVGPGTVLASLIESEKVPVTKLTEPYRQSEGSKITLVAHAVNNGIVNESLPADMVVSDINELSTEKAIQFAPLSDSKLPPAIDEISSFVSDNLGLEDIMDYQILTPQRNWKDDINEQCQTQNPEPCNPMGFKKNDKVMQTRNDYQKEIFNGMIGTVEGFSQDEEGRTFMTVNFVDDTVQYDSSELDDLDLAYASTIHKTQGSEFSTVIIVLPESVSHVLLVRQLLYTALTRGKKHVIILGSKESYRKAVSNSHHKKRCTLLRYQLESNNDTHKEE